MHQAKLNDISMPINMLKCFQSVDKTNSKDGRPGSCAVHKVNLTIEAEHMKRFDANFQADRASGG